MRKSYIQSVYSRDIGFFKEIQVDFNSKFNYIVGPNASGKSSLLKCIALAFSNNVDDFSVFRFGPNPENWVKYYYDDIIYRIGRGERFIREQERYRGYRRTYHSSPPKADGIKPVTPIELEDNNIRVAPLFIGAYRRISYIKINGMIRELDGSNQREKYQDNGINNLEGITLPEVKQWMINRYFQIDKKWAKVERINWNWLMKNLPKIAPEGSQFHFIEIRKNLESFFNLDGNFCFLEELSAGYQAFLSMVFHIIDWIEGINEEKKERTVQNATGTVVIDELDIHMHPEWQLTVRNALDLIFPNLQFIVTTHSPHLIATANKNEIIILDGFSREVKAKPVNKSYSGWTTDQILEDVMGVKNLVNKQYNQLLQKCLDAIDRNDLEGFKSSIRKLEEVSHPKDTIISELRIKLSQMIANK